MRSIQRILVPIDFTRGSEAAIDYAVLVATALGASITLMHAIEPAEAMGTIVPGASAESDTTATRVAASGLLEQQANSVRAAGFARVDSVTVSGYPAESILAHARKGEFNLIAMGTHGRQGFHRLIMGSVAEVVVRRAPCAVLTVHLPADDA